MPTENRAEVVAFDADAACRAAREAAGDALRTFVEFDADAFNPLYVDDATRSLYEDDDHMEAHFSRIHSYVHVDLAEMDLMTGELFPVADRVEFLVTALDAFTLVRLYLDGEGLFLALDPGEPVQPVVGAIRAAVSD